MTKNNDKIVLVFSRKELERKCVCCYVNEKNKCDKTDDDLINCNLIFSTNYKIKGNKNGKEKH